jgi:predicted cupin superfamily sugar epimerase
MTAADVKKILKLHPHPREGGWYVRTFESEERFVPQTHSGERFIATAIYYLLEPQTFSEMHQLRSDEIFHHYLGAPVEMLQLHADGTSSVHILGSDLLVGQVPQMLVRRNVWQGSRLLPGSGKDAFALLGCTVSPGFEFDDYHSSPAAHLIAQWPAEEERIKALSNF